jgi:AAA domain
MSELHSWARALGGEVSGGQILCPGPGHSPKDRSLSVKIGRDGEPICYSHSGNDWPEAKDYVREKVGLEPFKPKGNGEAKPAPHKRQFDYPGPDGALLYQVEREDLPGGSKKIRQRRPDGNGGWVWNLGGVEPIPYRLPDLLEALANGHTILIAEGEAKVDLLWSWNVPATCNSGGAGKWRAHHSAYLAGADVVILPDNDGPGRQHAQTVEASLKEAGATVRILDLPGLPPKGDVIDWAAAGGTVEQLHELIEREARPWQANGETPPKRFELVPFDKIAIDTTPAYLVKGIIPRTGLCIFWGPPKCGKSFLVFDMVMHIALGWEYRERKVRQGAVVYCALEGCSAFKNRIEAFRRGRLSELASGVPFHLMASPLSLVVDHAALIASIRDQCPNPAVVAIDTLNRSMPGSESSDEDMAAYIKAADAIRDAFNCAVVIVHHCGHEGTRPRGHSSLMGALDAQIAVTRDAADTITATVELMKDGPQGESFSSRLKKVELGTDDDGDPISSCVVEAAKAGAAQPRVMSDAEIMRAEFITVYDFLTDGKPHLPGLDGRSSVIKVPVKDIRAELANRGYLDVDDEGKITGSGRSQFCRAKATALQRFGFAERGGQIWRKGVANLFEKPNA